MISLVSVRFSMVFLVNLVIVFLYQSLTLFHHFNMEYIFVFHFSFSCSQHSNSLPHIDSVVNIAVGLGFTESGQSETLLLLRSLSEKHINDLQYNLNVAHGIRREFLKFVSVCVHVFTFYNSQFEKGKVTQCSYQGKNIFETFGHRYIFSYKHLLRCIPY